MNRMVGHLAAAHARCMGALTLGHVLVEGVLALKALHQASDLGGYRASFLSGYGLQNRVLDSGDPYRDLDAVRRVRECRGSWHYEKHTNDPIECQAD